MYLRPQTRALFDGLKTWVLTGTNIHTIDNLTPPKNWHHPAQHNHMLFGQICGITYANMPAHRYQYLATLCFDDPTIPVGFYNSIIITHKHKGLANINDFDQNHHMVAINEYGSFSGSITLREHLLGKGNRVFSNECLSRSHLNSIKMVANAKADIACIDRLSFHLAKATQPSLVRQLRILDQTTPHPGLPFVAPRQTPDALCNHIITRLKSFFDTPTSKLSQKHIAQKHAFKKLLGVSRAITLATTAYSHMPYL